MLRSSSLLVLITIVALCAAGRADALPHSWSQGFGDQENQYAPCVATDANGDVLIAGAFSGSINLGGGTFSGGNNTNIFLEIS